MNLLAEAAAAAASLGPLILGGGAQGVAEQGAHARRRAGAGAEFWQYRPLEPGEAATRIDWRRSARSDTLFARERERDAPARLWVWAQGGASMQFASARAPTKATRARLLVAALATAAARGGETIAADGAIGLEAATAGLGAGANPPAFDRARAGDRVVAAGDWLAHDAARWAAALAARGVDGVVLAIADSAERDFPFMGAVRFTGDGATREVARAEAARAAYLAAFDAHRARLSALPPGWRALHHATDEPVAPVLVAAAAWLAGAAR